MLWGNSEWVRVSVNRPAPPGHRLVESFAVLPSASRPRFLVPLSSRRVASRSLRLYNALRPPRRRLARGALAVGMSSGIGQLALRDRVNVSVPHGPSPGDLSRLLLSRHLGEVLGGVEVAVAVGIGGQGPFRKPVLQALSAAGRPVGFVKVGWNDVTRRMVGQEARALARAGTRRLDHIGVPALIHHGGWRNLEISVASPLPDGVRRYEPSRGLPSAAATAEVAGIRGLREMPLGHSNYWAHMRGRLGLLLEGEGGLAAEPLVHFMQAMEEGHSAKRFSFGTWHGDWAPWNLAWSGRRLFAWDWEYSGEEVPLGFDPLHFEFQLAFILERTSVGRAATRCRSRAAPLLHALGVPGELHGPLASLYLLEIFFRHYEAKLAGAGHNPRFFPAAYGVFAGDPG